MKHSHAKALRRKVLFLVLLCVIAPLREIFLVSSGQTRPSLPVTLELDQESLELETRDFRLRIVKSSQTVAALEPKSSPGFDFTPADRLSQRAANRYHHLGDLILRVRAGNAGPWQKYDTAESRQPVEPLTAVGPTIASANLAPALPAEIPVQITRSWILDNGRLVLRFELRNKTEQPVQLGAVGLPMVFNNT